MAANPGRRSRTVSKSIAQNVLLMLGCILAFLLAAEGFVRLAGLGDHLVTDPVFAAVDDPRIRYHYKPMIHARALDRTELTTNSLGFRSVEPDPALGEGDVRVVVLGDSYTFGQGVPFDRVYTQLLQKSLSERIAPRRVEILNFGVQGYTVDNEVGVYLGIAGELSPDLAVLSIISDDLNLARNENFVDRKGYLTKRVGGMHSLKAYLRTSRLALLAKEAYLRRVYQRSGRYQVMAVSKETLAPRLTLLDRRVGEFVAACAADSVVPVIAVLDTWDGDVHRGIIARLRSSFPEVHVVECIQDLVRFPQREIVSATSGHPTALAHERIAATLDEKLDALIRLHLGK